MGKSLFNHPHSHSPSSRWRIGLTAASPQTHSRGLPGGLDFGLALYAKALITPASQEGARYGTIYHLSSPIAGDLQGYVQSYLYGAGFSQPVTITVTGAVGASGTPLAVRVNYTDHFLGLPSFLAGWADSLNLSAETLKRLE